jgi:hypothetical protein
MLVSGGVVLLNSPGAVHIKPFSSGIPVSYYQMYMENSLNGPDAILQKELYVRSPLSIVLSWVGLIHLSAVF